MVLPKTLVLATVAALAVQQAQGLQPHRAPTQDATTSRRAWISQGTAAILVAATATEPALAASSPPPDLKFVESPTGIKYADAKVGTGQPITTNGSPITIDYVLSTTGARYGSKIYSTQESNIPYRFKLGDGSTIAGLELAIAGGDGIEPMRPGGIRRVEIPSKLAYENLQFKDCEAGKGVGPIPPAGEGNAGEYYQRFKNIYCNVNRAYQPDIVMDVKLYGKR